MRGPVFVEQVLFYLVYVNRLLGANSIYFDLYIPMKDITPSFLREGREWLLF